MNNIGKNRKWAVIAGCFLLMLGLMLSVGCGRSDGAAKTSPEEGRLSIVCTLFPQYDFARYIAGDYGQVTMLLPPGTEAHMYDPTPEDMKIIADCDVFIYTGAAMEGWAAQIVESLSDGVQVLDLSKHVTLHEEMAQGEEEHHHHGGYDPHYWLDMDNATAMVQAIGQTLETLDPEHAGVYGERAEAYVRELEALDEAFYEVVENSPRDTVVFGGRFAYSYFLERYALKFETVYHTCSAESDPSVQDMIRVIDFINENQITCIFYEELASGTVAKTIAEDTDIEMAQFTTGHNVSREEFDAGLTFLDLMERNLLVLKGALQG